MPLPVLPPDGSKNPKDKKSPKDTGTPALPDYYLPDLEDENEFPDDESFADVDLDDESLYEDDDYEDEPEPVSSYVPHEISLEKEPVVEDEEDEEDIVPVVKSQTPTRATITEDDAVFADVKTGKLKPFGRKPGRKAKVGEFDPRKNLRRRSKMIQYAIIGLVSLIALLGLKNALFPPATLSQDDVENIVASNVNNFGYPLDKGGAFATDFMKAYLNNITTTPNADDAKALNFFYSGQFSNNGTSGSGAAPNNATVGQGFSQRILYGPTLYKKMALSANSASYMFGVILEPQAQGTTPPTDGSASRLSFFNVTVYYNTGGDSFAISPDSPTAVPSVNVASGNLPSDTPLGTGESPDASVTNSMQSLITGFVQGYAVSSPGNHSKIDQYVVGNPPAALLQGLNGRYDVPTPDQIKSTVYSTADPAVYKVLVQVTWQDTVSTSAFAQYNSTYVMTVVQQDDNKYLVAQFSPKYYIPDLTNQ